MAVFEVSFFYMIYVRYIKLSGFYTKILEKVLRLHLADLLSAVIDRVVTC